MLRTYTRHRPASSKHEHAELLLRSNDRNWLKWRLLPKRGAANGVPIGKELLKGVCPTTRNLREIGNILSVCLCVCLSVSETLNGERDTFAKKRGNVQKIRSARGID